MAAQELEHILPADIDALIRREQEVRTYGVVEVHLQAGQITRVHVQRTEIIRAKVRAEEAGARKGEG